MKFENFLIFFFERITSYFHCFIPCILVIASKMCQYGVFSCPYFPAFGLSTEIYSVFSPNARKCGPEKTPYLDTFHVVCSIWNLI